MPNLYYPNPVVAKPKEATIEKGLQKLIVIRDNEEELMSLRVRATLMVLIIEKIRAKKYTQKKASEVCDITQPGVSNLITGKIENFSLDRLVRIAARLNISVNIEATEAMA